MTAEDVRRELDDLRDQIAALEEALKEKPEYGPGEGDPAVTRLELDRALLQQLRERAAGLERTLARADEGTYGICVRCGTPIHPDRLAVLPGAKLCIRCARAAERDEFAL